MAGQVKVCGVRSVHDALMAVHAGVDALGLNFVRGRSRSVEVALAAEIVAAVRGAVRLVGILCDPDDALLDSLSPLALDAFQLHGTESPSRCAELLARGYPVYKALAIGSPGDVRDADRFPGSEILFDAAAAAGEAAGGRGLAFDWSWLRDASPRPYWLAGGLHPGNVGRAIIETRAAGVDVASGVEGAAGIKAADKLQAFVARAREAFAMRPAPAV